MLKSAESYTCNRLRYTADTLTCLNKAAGKDAVACVQHVYVLCKNACATATSIQVSMYGAAGHANKQ